MPFGKDYHPRIAQRPTRDAVRLPRAAAGQNLVHAADHNARVTLEALRREAALSRQDLAAVTGLTAPGISNITRRLLSAGLVREVPGKRATRFAIEPDGAFGMGIDIDDVNISALIVDLAGRVRVRERQRARSATAADIALAVGQLAAKAAGRLPAAIAGRLLGIGVAGAAEPDAILQALSGYTAILERDTVCSALGERLVGAAPADGSFVHVLFGRGVRAGLMIRGALFDGVSHRAGLIGQMRTGDDGRLLDEVASLNELAPYLEDYFSRPGADAAFLDRLDADGRAAVERWLDRTTSHFIDAAIAISGFIAPSTIFIGGRLPPDLVARLAERLAAARAERMRDPIQPHWLPSIVPATLGPDCIVLGAAILPFLEFLLPDPRRPSELRGMAAIAELAQ